MKTNLRLSVAILLAILPCAAVQPSLANTGNNVLDHYLAVQDSLARDSMRNVSVSAQALAAGVRGDETMSLPTAIAEQADALAKAKSLAKARKLFKPLSEFLIAHLIANNTRLGTYYEIYCPIAKASWFQTDETIRKPYLGPRSATPTWGWTCAGVVRRKFGNPPLSQEAKTDGTEY